MSKKSLAYLAPLLAIISFGILAFGAFSVLCSYNAQLKLGVEEMRIAKNISNLVHNLQTERGLSLASSANPEFLKDLKEQRALSDESLKTLKNKIAGLDDLGYLQPSLDLLSDLESARKIIDENPAHTNFRVHTYYTNTISELISAISYAALSAVGDNNIKMLNSFTTFLRLKELNGQARASGSLIAALDNPSLQIIKLYVDAYNGGLFYYKIFNDQASQKMGSMYQNSIMRPQMQLANEMAEALEAKAVKGEKINFDAKQWFDTMTYKINELWELENTMGTGIRESFEADLRITTAKIYVYSTLCVIFLLSMLVMIFRKRA